LLKLKGSWKSEERSPQYKNFLVYQPLVTRHTAAELHHSVGRYRDGDEMMLPFELYSVPEYELVVFIHTSSQSKENTQPLIVMKSLVVPHV
jgi:hypothetical protein